MIISFKKNLTCFKTNGAKIIPEPLVTSLGIETDEKINFDKVSNDKSQQEVNCNIMQAAKLNELKSSGNSHKQLCII